MVHLSHAERAFSHDVVFQAKEFASISLLLAAMKGEVLMRRYGQVIKVKPECIADYERMHAQVWPEVLATIHACNIRNYSIFRHKIWLFAYFEYIGDDFTADMQKMAADPKTQEWWSYTDAMQEPLPGRAEGDWWTNMKEVFYTC